MVERGGGIVVGGKGRRYSGWWRGEEVSDGEVPS